MSYVGIITATSAPCLLGGVRQITSSRFQAEGDAWGWVVVQIVGNLKDNRPCTGDVFTTNKKPQLLHCFACGNVYDYKVNHSCPLQAA